jgi:hypothetical protein
MSKHWPTNNAVRPDFPGQHRGPAAMQNKAILLCVAALTGAAIAVFEALLL